MFYHLEGVVSDIDINLAVIDCGGVGYAVNTTANTLSRLKVKEKAKIYISEYIKEDCFDLYGFATLSEKRCFEMLLTVSGIGPKAAQAILSTSTPEALAMAIMTGDEKAITVAQGVGKKIAQRVILELKDKLSFAGAQDEQLTLTSDVPVGDDILSQTSAALESLGYTSGEIAAVLPKLSGTTDVQAALKQALKLLARTK